MCSWCDKFIVVQTLNRQVKLYTIYNISVTHKELKSCRRWPLWHMMYVMCTELLYCIYIKTCWQGLYRVFLTWRMGDSPHQQKICSFTPSTPNFYSLTPKVNLKKNKNILFSCSHCPCTIFVLISHSFKTQIMLILILIDVQYSQFLNRQNHSS